MDTKSLTELKLLAWTTQDYIHQFELLLLVIEQNEKIMYQYVDELAISLIRKDAEDYQYYIFR